MFCRVRDQNNAYNSLSESYTDSLVLVLIFFTISFFRCCFVARTKKEKRHRSAYRWKEEKFCLLLFYSIFLAIKEITRACISWWEVYHFIFLFNYFMLCCAENIKNNSKTFRMLLVISPPLVFLYHHFGVEVFSLSLSLFRSRLTVK